MPDPSPWFPFTVAVLATWRLAHLVAREDGPFDLVLRVRARAGDGMLGRLMDCPYCLSLWIAAPAALLVDRRLPAWCALWLAVSGGSCLLEKLAARAAASTMVPLEGGSPDALLRTASRGNGDPNSAVAGER
jgi:hypothetical protein